MAKILFVMMLLFPFCVLGAEPTESTKEEIAYLFNYLERSGCEFNRNGAWYNAAEAADHLNKKYEYLLKKQLITTTQDFIDRVVSKSSASGKPYQVKCSNNAIVESGAWFKAALDKYHK